MASDCGLRRGWGCGAAWRIILILVLASALLGTQLAVNPGTAKAANILLDRYPSLGDYAVNDGTGVALFWWQIEFLPTRTADHYTFKIVDPNGVTKVFQTSGVPVPLPPGITVPLPGVAGAPSPIYNPEFIGPYPGNFGNASYPGEAHSWQIPACSTPGTYTARIEFYSSPSGGGSVVMESAAETTFDVAQPIQVRKFNDLNGNGTWDAGEPEIVGTWNVLITGPAPGSGVVYNGTMPYFGNLTSAGNYTAKETLKSGWRCTKPGGLSQTFEVPCDGNITFGNQKLGNLTIFKYFDVDHAGEGYDPFPGDGDIGLDGWKFDVTRAGNFTYLVLVTTADGGKAELLNLIPDDYTVTELLNQKPGWTNSDPGTLVPPNPFKTLAVSSGGTADFQFGNWGNKTSLKIFKFHDMNRNGVWDLGEEGLNGWHFVVNGPGFHWEGDTPYPRPPDLAPPAPDGWIYLEVTNTGDYTATETLKDYWQNTKPGEPPPYSITVDVSGPSVAVMQFGNVEQLRPPPPRVPSLALWSMIGMIGAFATILVLVLATRQRQKGRRGI